MKRILSIDGGGIRGLIPALLLASLEAATGKACRDQFDMLAGTSTGAIVAVGLLAWMKAQDLVDLYVDHGAEIFSSEDPLRGAIRPRYSAAPLEGYLRAALGSTWLSETKGPELLVPATCVDPVEDGFFFKSWKARGTKLNVGDVQDDLDFQLWEVARASSAAPTYFPTAVVQSMSGKTYYLVDGGLHSNNPAPAAVASASDLWGGEEIRVLSLGTGRRIGALDGVASQHWGAVEWATEGDVVSLGMDAIAGAADYQMACMKGRGVTVDRVQVTLPSDATAMDDATPENVSRLRSAAAGLTLDPYWTKP